MSVLYRRKSGDFGLIEPTANLIVAATGPDRVGAALALQLWPMQPSQKTKRAGLEYGPALSDNTEIL